MANDASRSAEPTTEAPEPDTQAESQQPSTTKSEDGDDKPASSLSHELWEAMRNILNTVYDHRQQDGHDPSAVFHRKVNKRIVPDYYDVIKEPIALSTIKSKIAKQEYMTFEEFVRDFALIPHNAQVYNLQSAPAYADALEVKRVLQDELQKVVDQHLVTSEAAQLPFLGEIPPQEDAPAQEEEDDEEEESSEDDDEENEAPRRRGRPSKAEVARREARAARENRAPEETEAKRRRGRPLQLDTPLDARLKNILKGMRKPRNGEGKYIVSAFERLPDKAAMPEYYGTIKTPMALDTIKKKVKRRKYSSVSQFLADANLMFENAKTFNEEDSPIFKDTLQLQAETLRLAEAEQARPDTDFPSEDGRIPLVDGILNNGELYKVGDWVHIANPNDLTKPIPAQVWRTWQDVQGRQYVNACWYYRPEQTVHRHDRHFLEHEVVKTGQYRDHAIDEVVDRCFVMFITRFSRGRPRGFPSDKDVYVCESRYNEDKHTFNRIKTWASCLPDEVRDQDYEMDLFDEPQRLKKVPSPIAYLLKDSQLETDGLPQPQWGADNAPPKIGAVHRRPRDPKDSPPPEPTPGPAAPPAKSMTPVQIPPAAPAPPARQPAAAAAAAAAAPSAAVVAANQALPAVQYPPRPNQHALNATGRAAQASPSQLTPQPRPGFAPQPATPSSSATAGVLRPAAAAAAPAPAAQPTPVNFQPRPQPNQYSQPAAARSSYAAGTAAYGANTYQVPQPVEVYTLNDAANAVIPTDIREQFQRDQHGRVLFFTSPPLLVNPFRHKDGVALGHSARYLAARARREEELASQRKRRALDNARAEDEAAKRRRFEEEALQAKCDEVRNKALAAWIGQLRAAASE